MNQELPHAVSSNTDLSNTGASTRIVPADDSQMGFSQPADCRVKWLEIVALSLGGVGLIGAAIVGLGHKLMTNMQDSYRVEKIAKHIVRYQFPQAPSQGTGTIGLSIGAEAFAVISDRPSDPKLRLFVQKSPVDPVERTAEFVREMGLTAAWSGCVMQNSECSACGTGRDILNLERNINRSRERGGRRDVVSRCVLRERIILRRGSGLSGNDRSGISIAARINIGKLQIKIGSRRNENKWRRAP